MTFIAPSETDSDNDQGHSQCNLWAAAANLQLPSPARVSLTAQNFRFTSCFSHLPASGLIVTVLLLGLARHTACNHGIYY